MRSTSGRALVLVLALALLVALVWTRYLWGSLLVRTVIARQAHLDLTVDGQAVLVRNERLFAAPLSGTVTRLVSEGTLVIAGSPVMAVDGDRGEGPAMEVQLEYLRASRDLYRAEHQALLTRLSVEGRETSVTLAARVAAVKDGGDQEALAELGPSIEAYADWRERWMVLWDDHQSLLCALERLEMWVDARHTDLTSPVRGFVSYRHDGLEEVLRLGAPLPRPSLVSAWGRHQALTISDGDAVEAGRVVFRVAEPDRVGFYLPVGVEDASHAELGRKVAIVLPSGREVPAELEHVTPPDDGIVGLLFVTDRFLADLVMPRQMEILVRLRRVPGVPVPASSVVYRGGQAGVWLWYTDRPTWQPVHVKAAVGDTVVVDGIPTAVSVVVNPRLLYLMGVR